MKHKAYYQTVYYKMSNGNDEQREMRYRITGVLYAKSKTGDISNAVSNNVDDVNMRYQNKDKADGILVSRKHQKRMNKLVNDARKKHNENRHMHDIAKVMAANTKVALAIPPISNTNDLDDFNISDSDDGVFTDTIEIEKGHRHKYYNKQLTEDKLELFDHNDIDGALEIRQMVAYCEVLKDKFIADRMSRDKWLVEDPYYFEAMKDPIDKAFIRKFKHDIYIFFPMLTFNGGHWIMMVLHTKEHTMHYYEHTIELEDFHEYNDVLVNTIKKANLKWIWGRKFVKENVTKQWDLYNCGIITLKNMSDLLLTGKTMKYTSDNKAGRDKKR